LWGTVLGILVYAAFVAYAGVRSVASSLSAFDFSAFGLALALASGNYLLRFFKWEYYLARLGISGVSKSDSLLLFLSGFVLTVTPGKIGEVFKSALLQQTHKVPAARTAPIVFAERLTDVIGVVVLILIGSASFPAGLLWAGLGALAVLGGLILILWEAPLLVLIRWCSTRDRLRRLSPRLEEARLSLRIVASPAALLIPTLLSIVGWGAEGYALCLILEGFGVEIAVERAIFFYATATLAGALVPVPGGLGITEGLIQEQLVHLGGTSLESATASMLLIRLATLWWAVLVGVAALGLLKARYPSLLRAIRPPGREVTVPSKGHD
jgi:uncharacterized protein (TIRG00374 family)